MSLSFLKMHGLGNDFVIIDSRLMPRSLDQARIRKIADRRMGAGCDQLILLLPPQNMSHTVRMRIFNADGSEAGACGNASRCVAAMIMQERGLKEITIETVAGVLVCFTDSGTSLITVDMGPPRLKWKEIPLASAQDTLHVAVSGAKTKLGDGVAVNMGNPHIVFFVEDAEGVDVEALGPVIETHDLFPEHTNVEFVTVQDPQNLRMRVWERGTGVTLACGSGACAALVAAVQRGLTARQAQIHMDGGSLTISWREEDGHVLMAGPVMPVYKGEFSDKFLDA